MLSKKKTPQDLLAVVTGGGSGLGRAYCLQLAASGHNVVIVDQATASAEETLALVQAAGGRGEVKTMDVRHKDQWAALVADLKARHPHVDVLVNNAGVAGSGEIGAYDLADWRWMVDINLMGYVYGCHMFVGWLKQNPRGAAILNTSSVAGFLSAPTMGAYNATKAAISALTETLYTELRGTGVRVTLVAPYFFQTNLLNKGRFAQAEEKAVAMKTTSSSRLTAEILARAALKASKKGQLYVFAPFVEGFVYWILKRLFPEGMLRIVSFDGARRLNQARRYLGRTKAQLPQRNPREVMQNGQA